MKEPKEGVDFKWVPMKDSKGNIVKDGKGKPVKTRKFFTRAEKEAMKNKKAAPKKKSAAPKTSKRPKTRPGIDDKKAARTRAYEGKTSKPDSRKAPKKPSMSMPDKSPSAMTSAPSTMKYADDKKAARTRAKKPTKDYTYQEWRRMSRAERRAAGLPVSELGGQMKFNRFMTGITGKEYTSKGNKASTKSTSGKRGDRRNRRGMAKGGVVKANCGASTKPNRMARK